MSDKERLLDFLIQAGLKPGQDYEEENDNSIRITGPRSPCSVAVVFRFNTDGDYLQHVGEN